MEPLHLVSASVLVGCLVGAYADPGFEFLACLIALSLIGSLFAKSRVLFVFVLFMALSALRAEQCESELASSPVSSFPLQGIQTELSGTICEFPEETDNGTRLVLDEIELGRIGHRSAGRILLTVDAPTGSFDIGRRLSATGLLRPVSGRTNPGSFDFKKYFASREVVGRMSSVSEAQIEFQGNSGGYLCRRIGWKVRERIISSLEGTLDRPRAALLEGLLLGRRRALEEETREQFITAGLAHVLATSGLHVGIVAAIAILIGKLCRIPVRLGFLAGVLVAFVFVEASGARAPAMRAFYAVSAIALARLLGREVKPASVVAVTLLITLLNKPLSVFDPGFALSFSAVGGILIFARGGKGLLSKLIISPFLVSTGATFATLPFTAMYFSRIALLAPVVNLVALPLVGAAVVLGLLCAAIHGFLADPAERLAGANWLLLGFLEKISLQVSRLPFCSYWVSRRTAVYLAVLVALVFAVGLMRRRWVWVPVACSMILLAAVLVSKIGEKSQIIFLDVGQGDSAVIRLPGKTEIVIDGGIRWKGYDSGKRIVIPFLRREGIGRVELAVVTHCDADHIGGMYSILRQLDVERAALPWVARNDGRYSEFIQLCDSTGTDILFASEGDTLLRGDGWNLTAIWPSDGIPAGMSANDHSLVAILETAGTRVLLTGDIEHEAEAEIVESGRSLKCDLLKVPHHGSISSSTLPFVDASDPSIAVVSVSATNNFGQPAPAVIERYREFGTLILTTAQSGAVHVELADEGPQPTAMVSRGVCCFSWWESLPVSFMKLIYSCCTNRLYSQPQSGSS
jgi:competence protein ComEC